MRTKDLLINIMQGLGIHGLPASGARTPASYRGRVLCVHVRVCDINVQCNDPTLLGNTVTCRRLMRVMLSCWVEGMETG